MSEKLFAEDGPTCEELAGTLDEWPNCRTADCENKACLAIKSPMCFPCTAVHALLHQMRRNHEYKPETCAGCQIAARVVNLKGF
ncbi:MAG: hypothetical protein JWQ87_5437 [Candidatus Sulfotelmatobacter sp.]|nr:hypothetical protein [Candidatus Sulfotelmatobacter sp.]